MDEEILRKKVKFIVVAAMTLFFVLVTTLSFMLATRINQNATLRRLESSSAAYEAQYSDAKSAYEYYSDTLRYAQDYARRVHLYGDSDTTKIIQ